MLRKHTKFFTIEIKNHNISDRRIQIIGMLFKKNKYKYIFIDFYGTCDVIFKDDPQDKISNENIYHLYCYLTNERNLHVVKHEKVCFYTEMALLGEVISLRKIT